MKILLGHLWVPKEEERNQERNLWPRVSILQSEVELASPR